MSRIPLRIFSITGALALAVAVGWAGGAFFGTPVPAAAGTSHAVTAASTTTTTGPSTPGSAITTETIPNMVQSAKQAVVEITALSPAPSSNAFGGFGGFGGSGSGSSNNYQEDLGSGFFINASGEIVTNDHVINGASNIQVKIPGHTQLYPAKVIGQDYNMDLALLKVNVPFSVSYLGFANNSSIQVGQFAIAIGNPDGLNQTVTLGIISAEGRPVTIQNRQYVNLLQTDAAINPGNSGGPLLNISGQVMGVNTAVQTNAQGVGFAIPVSEIQAALPYLEKGQTMPQSWLGVGISDMNPQQAQQMNLPAMYGAYVAQVFPNSPASAAGLKVGDVITALNGQKVTSSTDLLDQIIMLKPNTQISLTYWRNGSTHTLTATLGAKPQNVNLQSQSQPQQP